MKTTGIVRRIDDLGRIVIPKEIRRTYRLHEGDPVEIFTSEEGIIFTKYDPTLHIEENAQNWLRDMKEEMDKQEVKFFIEEDAVTCIGKKNNRQVCSVAFRNDNEQFTYAIGMVRAYCQAFEIKDPLQTF